MNKKLFILILVSFLCSMSHAQSWDQMENEYNNLLKNEQNDLALNKAREIFYWVSANESDTSLHLPLSLKFIGSSSKYYEDALFYYDKALKCLREQNRSNHILSAKIHYSKSAIYEEFNKNDSSIIEAEKSIEILQLLNYPEYPFSIWPFNFLAGLYFDKKEYSKSEILRKRVIDITRQYKPLESKDYIEAVLSLGRFYYLFLIRSFEFAMLH